MLSGKHLKVRFILNLPFSTQSINVKIKTGF